MAWVDSSELLAEMGNGESCTIERMVTEHQRRLIPVLGELERNHANWSGDERAASLPVAGLVVGVDADARADLAARGVKYVGRSPGKKWSWKQSLPCHCPTLHVDDAPPMCARSWFPRVTK